MSNWYDTNKNARIVNRTDRTGKSRTETQRRDSGADFAISTDERNNSTNLFIGGFGAPGAVRLDGHEARTLYRLLSKHYRATGKSRRA